MQRDISGEYRRSVEIATRADGGDTLELSFSSELPVERAGGTMEILSHSPGDVDLSRLAGGDHPLLLNHNPDQFLGIVSSARIGSDRKGRASVKFSKSALAQEVLADCKAGIRKLCSVGYRLLREVASEVRDGREYVRYAWQPYEISIVPIPADTSVGVGRAAVEPLRRKVEIMNSPQEYDSLSPEQKRISELETISRRMGSKIPGCAEICQRAISEGTPVATIQDRLFSMLPGVNPVSRATIDFSERDMRGYSICRAVTKKLEAQRGNARFDGLERELSDEVAKQSGIVARGFFIPAQAFRSTHLAGTASLGGNIVATDLAAGSFIELLRNKAQVARLGARMLDGMVGSVVIPRQASAATAYWLTEVESTTATAATFDQLTLTPKCVTGAQVFSKQLMIQSTPGIEQLLRDDLLNILALAIDKAALSGGGGAEPTGIIGSGVTTLTVGAIPTFANIVSMESAVAAANADSGALGYLVNAATRNVLKTALKSTVSAGCGFIWENGSGGDGVLNGYKALVSNQLASNLTSGTLTSVCSSILFGDWSQLIMAQWAGLDVLVDQFTGAASREIKLYASAYVDVGVRHAAAFAHAPNCLTA
ncbi:MAG: phage major capsid protein [Verrucomicrobiota bacterium]